MIIDSHCHLDHSNLFNKLDDVLVNAKKNEVKYLLSICTTLDSFEKIKLIINKYENVYGTFGIHPHEAKNFIKIDKNYILKQLNCFNKIVGIGETGLDFYYNNSDSKTQKKSFIEHIQAAIELKIPLIVHSRNAEIETYEILKSEKKNSDLKILMHCFTGSKDFCSKLLDIGSYISISGIITFKNSNELSSTVSLIPNDRLLVETDSPYLAPVPYRGKINEPSYITHTVKKLSKIKNISFEDMKKCTSNNFLKIFNIN